MPIIPWLLGKTYKSVHPFIQQILIESVYGLTPRGWGCSDAKTISGPALVELTLPVMQTDNEQLGCVLLATSGWIEAEKDDEAGEGVETPGTRS